MTRLRTTLITGCALTALVAIEGTATAEAPTSEQLAPLLGADAPSELATGACPKHPSKTLEDFPPYKYEIRASHKGQLDALASSIARAAKKGTVRRVRIVGHAAKYGKSDFAKTARNRAAVVNAELTSRLADRGIDYSKLHFHVEGRSTDCPVATNSTKAGRAKNRRVELWIDRKAPPKKPKPRPKAKKLTVRDAIVRLKKTTSNPTTQCLTKKLLDAKQDHDYLPDDGLATFMAQPIQKVGITGYRSFERNLKSWMDKRLATFHRVPTKQPIQKRFDKAFANAQRSMLMAVNDLANLDCYDKRTPSVRAYIVRQSKNPKSLYSCPVVRAQVKSVIKKLGGVRGCRA